MTKRIFGIIGWLGFALVMAALAIMALGRTSLNLSAQWDQYRYYLAWAGLVCVLIYMAGQWRDIAEMFQRRQARYGTLAATSVLVVLGILVAVNYIGKRQNKRWDLTENKQFSLSQQSRDVAAKLDAPVEIMGFMPPADQPVSVNTFRDLLQEYAGLSNQIKLELVDVDRNPSVAAQNEVRAYGEIVVRHKGRTERVTSTQEQDVTNALIKVVSGQARTMYFTQGHGEKDPTSSEVGGYMAASESLKRENYTVEKLVLAQQGGVPDNATMVVVAGPRVDFLPGEIETLEKYLAKAGKLLLELDAPGPDESSLPNLTGLARKWGIDVGNNLVLDQTGMGQLFGGSAETPVAANYPSHAITSRLDVMTAFRFARSVTPVSGGNEGHTAQSIVETSSRSWAEADLKSLYARKQPSADEGAGDKTGPISIAAAVSAPVTGEKPAAPEGEGAAPKPETRVVVFGDSDFASNLLFTAGGNRDLFMNTVGWLSQQENLISIRPKEPSDRRLTMTAAQQSNIVWFSLLIVPLAIFGTGIYSWWRRR
jgi:gliding motility-associatede transport system auxiliary component